MLNQQPTTRQFWGKALVLCACLLTLLFLYGYSYGGWNPLEDRGAPRWAAIFSALPKEFLPDYKNPCWFEKVQGTDVDSRWREGRSDNGTGQFRLRCLPYFYIIGMPKCGTTDLYYRINQHPDVVSASKNEPNWWTLDQHQHLGKYLDYFDDAAWDIWHRTRKRWTSFGEEVVSHDVITGDGDPITIFYNDHWREELWDTPNNEPPILIADLIRAVQPNVKFILTLRNPTDRLYSDYLFWKFLHVKRSNTDFHTRVRLRRGLYEVYLRDWLSIFPRDQILVQRLEDHARDPNTTMTRVLNFLDLGPVRKKSIFGFRKRNSQKRKYDSIGQMLPKTRRILNEFYRPYNERLAELLNNADFLWQKESSV
ncbi:carbohydrate sulfotransferase 15-like [Branchiostoma floridae]|uniref:Sulfotransferase n=1 Tax=Branchiostoma floridae TaxID=7739 RepID=A0A9J7LQF4_BRAFL|nr:carbohydrate sulfotransferase 15-like [Branchiostoma floridae]